MRRRFLIFPLLFLAVALVVTTATMAGGTASPKAASTGSCVQSTTPQFVMPGEAPKPEPTSPVLCIIEICKLDHGTLYRCTVNTDGNCCRYQTNKDCVVDPACTATIPPYCPADPPNACNNTCQG